MLQNNPNVIFVLTDDQGYGDLGCTGNPIIETPHIDRLYQESLHFTNYHVGPTCAPTRSGLMTGHFANSTGVWNTVGGRSLLRKNEWTIGNAFSDHGYKTGIFGKWHLGDNSPYLPHERGFQIAITHGGGGISQIPDFWGNDYFDDTYSVNGVPTKFKGYCTDVFFSEAKKFIKENKEHPFFCYIALNAPHGPYNVPNQYAEKYRGTIPENRARFYGMIENIDENVGSIREFMKEEGIYENTIFIFMTDNGTSCGFSADNGFLKEGYNAGMRGSKNSPYEGGHRVPFFIHYPDGGVTQMRDYDEVTANVDVMPTLLDLCNIPTKDDINFHGMSLKSIVLEEDNPLDLSERVIVTDSQRILHPIKWRESAVCSKYWRLINGKELYNMQEDFEQRNDIAQDYPEEVKKLRMEYDKWWDLVSCDFDKPIPIDISFVEETKLTVHDLITGDGASVWHQGQVRNGGVSNGYYEINVLEKGKYRIEFSRWEKWIDTGIGEAINQTEDIFYEEKNINPSEYYRYSGSVVLNITGASLKIGNKEYKVDVNAHDKTVTFEVDLEAGLDILEGSFLLGVGEDIIAPYYIYMNRVS